MKLLTFTDRLLVQLIKEGNIGILPTDTIYGIHASAFSKNSIEKMYDIRLRDRNKPFILLMSDISDLEKFNIQLTSKQKEILHDLWQQSVSIVLPVTDTAFEYLTRGTGSLAFRIPQSKPLQSLLKLTGPIVSTSVNEQGEAPAKTISEAQALFGGDLSFAVDEGILDNPPSTLVELKDDKVEILRQGKAIVPSAYLV